MSAPLNVDPAQLHAVSGLAADAARDLQRELDQLEHRWEDLSSTWDGVASRAFGPEFDAWREGAQKTVAALDSASVTLAQHGYAFAMDAATMARQNEQPQAVSNRRRTRKRKPQVRDAPRKMMTDVHSRDRAGRTPLHYAAIDGPRDQVNAWQEEDPVRKAELHRQSVEFKLANVRHLIDSGADVNAKDDEGNTPLHFAATHDSAEVVRMLIDAGAEVDAANGKGETPLKCAAADPWTDPNTLQLLRDRGADPFRPANNGRSTIDYLRMIGNEDKRAPFADLL